METKKYSGIVKNGTPGKYWALCDQLPVAAFGGSYNDAIRNIIGSLERYQGAINGSGTPPTRKLDREEGTPFEVTITAP